MFNAVRYAWLLPFFIVAYGFMSGMSNDIYLPAMPIMVEALNTKDSMVQLTITGWVLGVGVLQLFMGPWSDHYGRRPTLIWGGLLFLGGSIACVFAPTVEWLIVARFFQGIGACSIMVVTFAIIKEVFTGEKRLNWLVYFSMVRALAPLIGPIIGGYVILYFPWQANFVLIFIMGLIAFLGMLFLMPETRTHEMRTSDFNINRLIEDYKQVLNSPSLLRYLGTYGGIFSGIIVYLTAGPFILIENLGVDEHVFGYYQCAISGAYIVGAFFVKRMHNALGLNKIIYIGLMLGLLGSLGMMLLNLWQETILFVVASVTLFSLGFGMMASPVNDKILAHEHFQGGILAGLVGLTMSIGGGLASLIVSFAPDTGAMAGAIMLGFALFAIWSYKGTFLN